MSIKFFISNFFYQKTRWKALLLVVSIVFFSLISTQVLAYGCGGTPTFNVPSQSCAGSKVTISFSSTGASVDSFRVVFGDGVDSVKTSAGSFDHIYASAGTYHLLLIRTIGACKDTTADSIVVNTRPSATFSLTNDSICSASIDSFKANATGVTYSWTFNGGSAVATKNVGISFNNSGNTISTVVAKLLVITSFGCKDSLSKNIYVMPLPSSSFVIGSDSVCAGISTNFTADSTGLSYSWKFSNGFSATTRGTSKTFSNAGASPLTIICKLVTINSFGCNDSSTKNLVVMPNPVAGFNFNNDSACSGSSLSFNNTSSSAISYKWDFGDGSNTTSASPSHIYTKFGNTYTTSIVKLIAYSGFGCKDSVTKTVTIMQKPDGSIKCMPYAPYTQIYKNCNNNSYPMRIGDSSTTASTDSIRIISWGDGSVDTLTAASFPKYHTYSTKGYFNLTILVVGKNGCTNNKSYRIYNGSNPSVGLSNPGSTTNLCSVANLFFPVTNTSNNPSGTDYIVTSNDGGSQTFTQPPPDTVFWSFTKSSCGFTSAGGVTDAFHIKIVATNPCGTTQATVEPITLHKNPVAKFSISPKDTVCVNTQVTFTDNSIDGFSLPSGGGGCVQTHYRLWNLSPTTNWDSISPSVLGDPSSWNDPSGRQGTSDLVIKFKATGTYKIKLYAANEFAPCGYDSIEKEIYVVNPPTPAFKVSPDSGCVQLTDTFLNTSTGVGNTYLWTINPNSNFSYQNGTSDTAYKPIVKFTNSGIYICSLTVTNACTTMVVTDTVKVKKRPSVSINTIANGCLPDTISPVATYNANQGVITSYSWSFPGGSPSSKNVQNAGSIIYSTAGSKTITAFATNECGTDSATQSFSVYTPTNISIGKSIDSICINNGSFTLSGYSPSGGIWSGSVVTSSGVFNPISSGVGTFTVKYTYTDSNGCVSFASKVIKVFDKPVLKFTFVNHCLDSAIQFIDSSTAPGSGIRSRKWSFGDGSTSTTASPSHTYTVAGTYTVKLVVVNNIGCADSLSYTVTVYPKPSIGFSVNDSIQCLNGNNFVYSNSSSISTGSISFYRWTFGDTSSSNATSPTHSFADTGLYTTQLLAVSGFGCRDSISKTMKVLLGPTVNFSINDSTQCLSGNSFSFTNSSVANGGSIISYQWSFGNGNTSSSAVPSNQTYSGSGTYVVKLVVTNSKGCKDSVLKNVIVYEKPAPVFSFGAASFCAPYTATVSNTTSASPSIASWKWSIMGYNAASISNTTIKQPVFSFPNNQSGSDSIYFIKLIAITTDGCTDSLIDSVKILARPKALFTLVNDSCGPIVFSAKNNSLFANSYTWSSNPAGSFSATTAAQPTISLPRNQTGSNIAYIIKMVAANAVSCSDSLLDTVVVYADPLAKFNMSNTDSCGPLKVIFTNTSSPSSGTSYKWDFGNGIFSNIKDTSITYLNNSGTDSIYSIKLVATSGIGCSDDTIRTVNIKPDAKAVFSATNTSGCAPFVINSSVISTSLYTGANNTYTWFANGSQIGTGSTFPGYTISGSNDSILIKLRVTSLKGCKADSMSMWFKTITNPKPDFIRSDTVGCNPLKVLFTNSSTPSGLAFRWEFGNSTQSSTISDSIIYTFTNFGTSDTTWKVKLIGFAGAGCKDSISKDIVIHPSAKPSFALNNDYCAAVTITPTNNTPASPSIASWRWNILDTVSILHTSNAQSPSFSFGDNQTGIDSNYVIWLYATTNKGCIDSVRHDFMVNSRPLAKYSSDSVCDRIATTFRDSSVFSSTGGNSYKWKFGDGDSAVISNPTHIYSAGGTYYNLLTIVSSKGCVDTLTQPVIVFPKPLPSFSLASSICSPATLSPSNTSAASPSISGWNWNVYCSGFGTRNSSLKNPSFTFGNNQTGSDSVFSILLQATTSLGCIDSVRASVTIKTRPLANFTADSFSCSPDTFTVNNSATFATSNLWSISPASGAAISSSSGTNPSFTFSLYTDSVIKTYIIKNVVTSAGGCKDSMTANYKLYPSPKALFNLSATDTCGPVNLVTQNVSLPATGLVFTWDLGNGISTNAKDTSCNYYNLGVNDSTYKLLLTATNTYQCIDTQTATLKIKPDAKAFFTVTDSIGCAPYNITSSKISATHYANANAQYKWFVNSSQIGSTQTGASLSFPGTSINTANDSILIKLVAISKAGCKNDTMKVWFKTIANPRPNFYRSDTVGCHPFVINLIDSSSPTSGLTYTWNLGNGQSSAVQNPFGIQYNNTGIIDSSYTIKLVVSAGTGCKDSIYKNVVVKPLPNPSFSQQADTLCIPGKLIVSNTSSQVPSILGYQWKISGFGTSISNDTSSSTTNISFPDNQSGAYKNYSTYLIVTSNFGCKDSVVKPVVVPTRPIAAFGLTPDSACGPAIFSVTNNSSYGATYTYSTPHKNVSISSINAFQPNISIPENNGTSDSTYILKLVVVSVNGCIDSTTDTVLVHPRPRAGFTADSTNSCGPVLVSFTNTSSSNTSLSYSWSFGDGATSTSTNPTHTFGPSALQDSVYTVTLIATSLHGCIDTIQGTIVVKPSPTARIKLSDTLICTYASSPATISIFNLSIGKVDTFYWDFGDGQKSKTTLGSAQSHAYTTEGRYIIKLRTYNECATSLDSAQVTVLEVPHVSFVLSDSVTCDSFVSITNTTTNSLQNGYITYKWDFGNGTSSSAIQPGTRSYTRNITGKDSVYMVKLTAFSRCDTVTYMDSLKLRPIPFANFTPHKQVGCSPFTATFYNQSVGTDSNASAAANFYVWQWGDSLKYDTVFSRKNIQHTYITGKTDTFTVKFWAFNECGVDSEQHDIIVYPNSISPFVSIDPANGMGCNPLTVSFTNNTTGANTFSWNFDGVNTSNTRDAVWTFTKADSFNVALQASNGCSDTVIYIPIIVTDPPKAAFVDSGNYCQPSTIYFKNSTSGANSYLWYFGDGDSSIAAQPSHLYSNAGSYQVKLIAYNVNIYGLSCTDTVAKTIVIYNKPIARITIDTAMGCESFMPKITASSSSYSNNYSWIFGNGSSSTQLNPAPTFITAGRDTFYTIRLVTNNNNSCNDTAYKTVFVYAKPIAKFDLSDTFDCFPAQIVYTNTSSSNAYSALWRFVSPDTSALFSTASYTYSKPGLYSTRLVVTSLFGCKDSIQKSVLIGGNDSLKVNTTDTVLCLGKTGTYRCVVSNPRTVKWDFGDGDTLSGKTVNHSWKTAGTYQVIMTMTGTDGCIDSAVKNIRIDPLPTVAFSINDTGQCVNQQSFIYTNASSAAAGISAYLWRLGNGNTSNSTNITTSYSGDGTYIVTLIATTNQGCIDSVKKQIIVYPKPTVTFAINDSDQCINGNNFIFTNSSSISSGSLDYIWNLGDGDTSTSKSLSHTYADSGAYLVSLLSSSNMGCVDSVNKYVYVRVKPMVSFVTNDTQLCLNGNVFIFANASTVAAGNMSYTWNFGDGNNSNSTSPSHTYTSQGTYVVKLKANSNFGCVDSANQTIVVWPKPAVSFSINDTHQCINQQNFVFTNNSSIASGSLSYEIDFGDGTRQPFTSANISHGYASSGVYNITLVAVSDQYCADSITKKVVVAPKPSPSFNINDTGQCVNQNNFIFTNQSSISSGGVNYIWSYGDGASYIPSGGSVDGSRIYNTHNTFFVKLKVISDLGCTDSIIETVTVFPKPTPDFAINDSDQCLLNNQFDFTNKSSIAYGSLNYSWDFDDSSASNGASPSHVYAHADTFVVKLSAVSDQGCIDGAIKSVFVRPMPVASFSIDDSDQCENNNLVKYNNSSTLGYGTYSSNWNFGDGNTSSLLNPSYNYTYDATFQVLLQVVSTYGCSDQIGHPVYIRPKPKADLTINDTDNCVLLDAQFTNQSSTDVIKWNWNFDDPTSGSNGSNLASPSHIYYQSGVYYPRLLVENNFGCFDTLFNVCKVYTDPVSAFSYTPAAACDTPIMVQFSNSSIGAVNYLWSFGNGKVSNAVNPATIYTATAVYPVSLISFSSEGCIDTLIIPYIVAAQPQANYLASVDSGCMPLTVQFTNQSSNGSRIFWDFGDGNGSVDSMPLHIYSQAGVFPVTLRVENGNCKDTVVKTNIEVWQKPGADFNWNFVGLDNAGIIQFNNTSNFADNYSWNFGDRLSSFETNPQHRYDLHGDYLVTLIASNKNNCSDTATQPIHIDLMKGLFVANAFTPEDNLGDARVFLPKGIGLKDYHLRIFTTWGELIWETTELENTRPKEGWNGTWKGHDCKQDVYVWKIEATFLDGGVWQGKKLPNGTFSTMGTVTLIR